METKKRVDLTYKKVETMPDLEGFEDNVVYISDKFGVAIHKCMCGCGIQTVMPIGEKGWNYNIDKNDNLSMHPSVGNYQFPCESHYIIYKGGANFV